MPGRAPHRFQLEWAELPDGPDDSVVPDPTPDDIDAILGVLAQTDSGFVILSSGDQRYVQAAAAAEPGAPLMIEHRAGDADSHMIIDEEVFDAGRLRAIFRAYLADPEKIAAAARWRRLEL